MSLSRFFSERPLRKYVYGYMAGGLGFALLTLWIPSQFRIWLAGLSIAYYAPYFALCPIISISLAIRERQLPRVLRFAFVVWVVQIFALILFEYHLSTRHYPGIAPRLVRLILFGGFSFVMPFHGHLSAVVAKRRLI